MQYLICDGHGKNIQSREVLTVGQWLAEFNARARKEA